MHGNFTHFAIFHFAFKDDLTARGNVGDFVQGFFVILAPCVGVESIFLVIERHTRADDIQHGDAVMGKSHLQQFFYLLGVARKRTRYKGRVGYERFHANVNGHVGVLALLLEVQALFCGSRELAFGQTIHTVIFNDVHHVHIAAHDVLELTHTNAG